jgi:DNA-binding GntR family transcriptional regulator
VPASTNRSAASADGLQIHSAADQVYAVLRDRIAAGRIARGDRLHQEDLAAELGVSRTPVREALRRLAAEGLVDLKANHGARVSSSDPDDLRLSYETRLVVEPGAARLAAARRLAGPMSAMRKAIAREAKAGRSATKLFQANRDFHLALVAGAGNEWLTRFMEQIWIGRIGAPLYEEHPDAAILQNDHRAHASIADAIETGDADLAEELTRGHIARSLELLSGR